MADAIEGAIRMIIDLSFIFIVLIAVLSQSQTTSDAHAQWRRVRHRSNNSQNAIKVKRQAMGNAAGGVQVPMSMPAGPQPVMAGPAGAMPGMGGMSGMAGMGGSPQFMGPHGIHHEFSCIGRLPRLYQDPWQCNRYYWCNYGSPPVPFSCPGGQLFDQELQSCTMALAVECRDFPEPLDALDMPSGGIGYPGHFGGMNGSPYSPGGMGMGSMGPMSSAGGGGLGPSVSGPMVVNNAMQPAGPPVAVMQPVPASLPAQVAMSSPMNSAPVGTAGIGGLASINMAQAAQRDQAAPLQGNGGMLSNNINLNQFANALLSAGQSQSHSNSINHAGGSGGGGNGNGNGGGGADATTACDGGRLGLFADTSKNCRTYFFCSPGGTKYEFQCTAPLLFSDRMKTCDNAENVVCDPPSSTFGNAGNQHQVVNGFAVNSPTRGQGFAGVISAAPDEAMPLRFPFQMNHLNNNNMFAKRQQAMGNGLQPDFMQASSNVYPNFNMQPQGNGGQAPPPFNSYGTGGMGNGPSPMSGMNPYSIHPSMYGQPPFTTGGASQLPHHLTQRSMQPQMPIGNSLPGQYSPPSGLYPPSYRPQPDPNYQLPGPPQPYPSPIYNRPPMNPAAEPQMEGTAANYPAHLPSPTYYPMPAGMAAPPMHQPTYQMGAGGAGQPHYATRGGMQHGPHAVMPSMPNGGNGPHNGPRGPMKIPFYDPEAEVEAGRNNEPGAAGATGAAGGTGAGVGPGQPAGLNSFPGGQPHQAQVGPMVMHPDVLMIEGTFLPTDPEVVLGTTSSTTAFPAATNQTVDLSTSATIRPMSPDIILPLHPDGASSRSQTPVPSTLSTRQHSAFPTKSPANTSTTTLSTNSVVISTS